MRCKTFVRVIIRCRRRWFHARWNDEYSVAPTVLAEAVSAELVLDDMSSMTIADLSDVRRTGTGSPATGIKLGLAGSWTAPTTAGFTIPAIRACYSIVSAGVVPVAPSTGANGHGQSLRDTSLALLLARVPAIVE